jgi:3-oxoacyl-[acyl-carrier-protein] synthase II
VRSRGSFLSGGKQSFGDDMNERRAWITGVGAATPLGHDLPTFSRNLLAGRSAARTVVDQNGDTVLRSPGCLIDDVPVPAGWSETEFRALPRVEQVMHWCASAALADAGWLAERRELRIGMVFGVGGEWVRHWDTNWSAGGTSVYDAGQDGDSLIGGVQRRLGLVGPTTTVAAACASGNYALAQARQWIRLGLVDVCLAGAVETITPICRANFFNLRALSRRADDPERASRPFDKDRDGFVMGEGAVVFALESDAFARRRGARVYADVAGFGATSDAFHMVIPSNDPAPAAAAIASALEDAGANPEGVDYINAHAPGTPVGDKAEAAALHSVFGRHVADVPVSSTKSMTGHLLSGAAAVEALACIVAMQASAIPPTINLDEPDAECQLRHVPHQAIEHEVNVALSNSFGFGGSNTSLVLRKAA